MEHTQKHTAISFSLGRESRLINFALRETPVPTVEDLAKSQEASLEQKYKEKTEALDPADPNTPAIKAKFDADKAEYEKLVTSHKDAIKEITELGTATPRKPADFAAALDKIQETLNGAGGAKGYLEQMRELSAQIDAGPNDKPFNLVERMQLLDAAIAEMLEKSEEYAIEDDDSDREMIKDQDEEEKRDFEDMKAKVTAKIVDVRTAAVADKPEAASLAYAEVDAQMKLINSQHNAEQMRQFLVDKIVEIKKEADTIAVVPVAAADPAKTAEQALADADAAVIDLAEPASDAAKLKTAADAYKAAPDDAKRTALFTAYKNATEKMSERIAASKTGPERDEFMQSRQSKVADAIIVANETFTEAMNSDDDGKEFMKTTVEEPETNLEFAEKQLEEVREDIKKSKEKIEAAYVVVDALKGDPSKATAYVAALKNFNKEAEVIIADLLVKGEGFAKQTGKLLKNPKFTPGRVVVAGTEREDAMVNKKASLYYEAADLLVDEYLNPKLGRNEKLDATRDPEKAPPKFKRILQGLRDGVDKDSLDEFKKVFDGWNEDFIDGTDFKTEDDIIAMKKKTFEVAQAIIGDKAEVELKNPDSTDSAFEYKLNVEIPAKLQKSIEDLWDEIAGGKVEDFSKGKPAELLKEINKAYEDADDELKAKILEEVKTGIDTANEYTVTVEDEKIVITPKVNAEDVPEKAREEAKKVVEVLDKDGAKPTDAEAKKAIDAMNKKLEGASKEDVETTLEYLESELGEKYDFELSADGKSIVVTAKPEEIKTEVEAKEENEWQRFFKALLDAIKTFFASAEGKQMMENLKNNPSTAEGLVTGDQLDKVTAERDKYKAQVEAMRDKGTDLSDPKLRNLEKRTRELDVDVDSLQERLKQQEKNIDAFRTKLARNGYPCTVRRSRKGRCVSVRPATASCRRRCYKQFGRASFDFTPPQSAGIGNGSINVENFIIARGNVSVDGSVTVNGNNNRVVGRSGYNLDSNQQSMNAGDRGASMKRPSTSTTYYTSASRPSYTPPTRPSSTSSSSFASASTSTSRPSTSSSRIPPATPSSSSTERSTPSASSSSSTSRPGERSVPGSTSNAPSSSPDTSDPDVNTDVMPS